MKLRTGFALLALGVFLSFSAQAEEKTHRVQFRWAFGALISNGGGPHLVSVVRDTALKTGDQVMLFVEPRSDCFVYVVFLSAENEIQLLFPKDLTREKQPHNTAGMHYIPRRAAWFKLNDKTGTETFYILAAAERLTHLEELLTRYQSADGKTKMDVIKEIQTHIRDLRRQHSVLFSQPEKPAAIAGVVRGTEPDIAQFAMDVSVPEFYARTITIDHR